MIRNIFRNLFYRKTNPTVSLGYGNVQIASCTIDGHEGILFIPASVKGMPGTDVPPEQWPKSVLRDTVLIRFKDKAAADRLILTIQQAFDDDIAPVTTMSGRFLLPPE
jgi:hypothetical protein